MTAEETNTVSVDICRKSMKTQQMTGQLADFFLSTLLTSLFQAKLNSTAITLQSSYRSRYIRLFRQKNRNSTTKYPCIFQIQPSRSETSLPWSMIQRKPAENSTLMYGKIMTKICSKTCWLNINYKQNNKLAKLPQQTFFSDVDKSRRRGSL
jgi:hypothetical protein